MAANCSARLASSSPARCRLIAAIDGDIRRACGHAFFDHHYRPVLASHRIATPRDIATQAAGSRVAV
jgi:hypothetical protein